MKKGKEIGTEKDAVVVKINASFPEMKLHITNVDTGIKMEDPSTTEVLLEVSIYRYSLLNPTVRGKRFTF